jgi:PKD repeat protein
MSAMKRGLLLGFAAAVNAVAQCLLYPVPLAQRVAEAELIVEGRLERQQVLYEPIRPMLYTVWRLRVTKLFMGEYAADTLLLVHEGGRTDTLWVEVHPSAPLAEGVVGTFLLRRARAEVGAQLSAPAFELVAGPQGVLVYELQSGWAWDPFARYPIGELYRSLEQLVGQPYRERAPLPLSWQPRKDAPARPLATITGFTPTQITAGTFDTLRIFGSGFGSTPGSVQFPHADYGGSQWFTAPSNHIVLWSDTEIRVIVPTEAGTGNFRVVTSNNETVQSPSALSIPYAVLTLSSGGRRYRVRLVNANSAGGYTLVPNASFAANTDAFNAFKRALQTWRCGTYVNFGLAQTTTTVQCAADDGINVVSFDNTSCNLPSGVLGVTYNYYGGCSAGGNSYWYRRGMDLIFRRPGAGINWNFGPQPPGTGQYDFESVVLHELGHAHLLGHVIAPNTLMHYAIGPGVMIRTLGAQTDQAGGLYVMQYSTVSAPCGPSAIVALNSSNCVIGAPVARFGAQPLSGCPPLTVQFFDSSAGNPTAWEWDVNGDGVVDYTTQNCVHTYQQPGQYTVRLVVRNSAGSDTLIRPQYITVYELPQVDAGPDRTVCAGEAVRLGGNPTAQGGAPPYTYQWSPATGLDNPSAPNPTARLTSSMQYVLTVTDARGCRSSDTVTVVVQPLPQPRLSVVGAAQFCQGDSARLVAPSGYRRYRWNTGDTLPSITVRTGGLYWVVVTDQYGCSGSSDTVQITVFARPQAQVSGGSRVCRGDTARYSAAFPGAGDTYSWEVRGGRIVSGQGMPSVLVLWDTAGSGWVRLQQSTPQGCTAQSEPLSVAVLELNPPTVRVLGPSAFCEGDSTVLEAEAGYVRYRWNTGDTTRRLTVRTAGSYTVEVVSAEGCRAVSAPVQITVHPLPPKPSIERRGDTLECQSSVAIGYQWYLNGEPLPGERFRRLVAQRSGQYAVAIVDSNGCRAISDPVDVVISVQEPALGQPWACLPNPVTGQLRVVLPEDVSELVVVNVLGQVVLRSTPSVPAQWSIQLALEQLPPGVYSLWVVRGGKPQVWCRFVKM